MKIGLCISVIVLLARTAAAGDDTGTKAFDRLTTAAHNAQQSVKTIRSDHPLLGEYLDEVDRTAKDLSALYRTSLKKKQAPNRLPGLYLTSLDADSAALELFADKEKLSIEERTKAAGAIQGDLSLKYEFAAELPGGTFPSVIEVTVDTVHGDGQPANGLWVRCNPSLDGVTKHPMFLFNSATTPTTSFLPPGYLVMWIESSSGGFVVAQQDMKLGEGGKNKVTIRFPVP
jgi:hypothetical protein